MPSQSNEIIRSKKWRWLYLIVCLFGFYAVIPQIGSFHRTLLLALHAKVGYLLAAVCFTASSYIAAALTYRILLNKLRYPRTLLMQYASMFVNRLLPGGMGGIGANYAYLRRENIAALKAAAAVAINNGLGFLGNLILIVSLLIIAPARIGALHIPKINGYELLIILAIAGLGLLVLFRRKSLRHRVSQKFIEFVGQLLSYRTHPARLLGALLSSISLTLVNVLSFWMSSQAVGVHIGLLASMLVFTLGVAIGTVTPTPGGLGGVEAGLVAGLVAYHTTAAQALAAVLVYRFISYWSALVVGGVCFIIAEKRGVL